MIERFREIVTRVLTTHAAWPVLLAVGLLCTVSIVAIGLSEPERAQRQELHVILGAGLVIAVLFPHYMNIGRATPIIYGVTMVLLAGVLMTEGIKGSRRWYSFGIGDSGFQLQPSEIAKPAFVLMLAWYLGMQKQLQGIASLGIPALIMLLPFGLILIEPDLGTSLLFPAVFVVMIIAAGVKLRYLALVGMLAMISFAAYYPVMPQYQRERLIAMLPSVQEDVQHMRRGGYQSRMSTIAIGSGGLTGDPEGVEHIKQGMLPEAHNDFIFACVGAQWGFVGCVSILVLYLAFFAAAAEIAGSTKDTFGRLLSVGLASMILIQAIINMAMTMKLAPVVGIALPFVSYGGSSMLMNMMMVGLLLNVSIRRVRR